MDDITPPAFSVAPLVSAYQQLLAFRPTLLDRLEVLENNNVRKRALADSMIFGLLDHLHEVGSETDMWTRRLGNDYRSFEQYVSDAVDNFKSMDFAGEGIGGRGRGINRNNR